ncbi:hypothetical protein SAMN02746095_02802 [Acidocella aminolytica 101 = DSM 11237]|uniref:Uncharacterized protein n=1 Tax=Acidocella aminolytica 101 = DSM 11237 TaxID=1120923 RepID=A0A0D6PH24_9PROT|nr:hypothetical protein Aam_066_036 [Acidocella aminolytica 101 = DSM 11237]GBQ37135.1 hypothetical protein AA11237_1438 [Acidocella aminolytica 101 = DSM 11237]SHF31088.1 hypothetical protein SAMN02746095_02802 [Acidocella aminolytica 101 = DSM 11237]
MAFYINKAGSLVNVANRRGVGGRCPSYIKPKSSCTQKNMTAKKIVLEVHELPFTLRYTGYVGGYGCALGHIEVSGDIRHF